MRTSGNSKKLIGAFLGVHLLCCGFLLLGGAGVLAGVGTLTQNPLLLTAGVGAILAAGAYLLVRKTRRGETACCAPTEATTHSAPTVVAPPPTTTPARSGTNLESSTSRKQ